MYFGTSPSNEKTEFKLFHGTTELVNLFLIDQLILINLQLF